MKAYVYFSAAALATVLLASQAAAQTMPAEPNPPTEKRSLSDKASDMRTAAEQQAEAATAEATPATPSDAAMDIAAATAEPAVVTNGPVLDTAENRAKYPPMSRAGKRTAARGN